MDSQKTLSILFCFSIFARRLFINRGLLGFDIDLFAYPLYVFLFYYVLIKGNFRINFAYSVYIILLLLGIPYLFNGFALSGYLKTTIPLLIILPPIYSYLYKQDLNYFFLNYIKVSKWVAIIGFIQVFLKITIGFGLFSGYPQIDLHSIVTEPSHYVVVMLPAFVYTFFYYKSFKKEFWLILISLILTFKLTAFVSIFVIILIMKFRFKYILLLLPLGYGLYLFLISMPQYAFRIEPLLAFFKSAEYIGVLHGTPLSFLSNLQVAIHSANNFFIGGGLGSHPFAYDEFFNNVSWTGVDDQFGLNKNSGHSLLIRLLSETGYLGIILILTVLIICYNKVKNNFNYKVIYFSVLSHFIAKSIKLGGYIDFGTPIFFSIILILLLKSNSNYNNKRTKVVPFN